MRSRSNELEKRQQLLEMCRKRVDGDEPNVYFSVTFRNSKLSAKAVGQQQRPHCLKPATNMQSSRAFTEPKTCLDEQWSHWAACVNCVWLLDLRSITEGCYTFTVRSDAMIVHPIWVSMHTPAWLMQTRCCIRAHWNLENPFSCIFSNECNICRFIS